MPGIRKKEETRHRCFASVCRKPLLWQSQAPASTSVVRLASLWESFYRNQPLSDLCRHYPLAWRVIANSERKRKESIVIDFACSRFMTYASRPFISPIPASQRIIIPAPFKSKEWRSQQSAAIAIVRRHVRMPIGHRDGRYPGNWLYYAFF